MEDVKNYQLAQISPEIKSCFQGTLTEFNLYVDFFTHIGRLKGATPSEPYTMPYYNAQFVNIENEALLVILFYNEEDGVFGVFYSEEKNTPEFEKGDIVSVKFSNLNKLGDLINVKGYIKQGEFNETFVVDTQGYSYARYVGLYPVKVKK